MDFGLENKKVLVLASSSGLGLAIAKAYAAEGCMVTICGRDKSRLESALKEVQNGHYIVCDLDQNNSGTELVKSAIKKMSGIDILVTNAGGPPTGLFSDLTIEDWEVGYRGLYLSAVESIQEAVKHMKKNKWGRIILSTSTAAKQPIDNLTISNGIRSGLIGLMKTISNEVAPYGITVNALLPGSIDTDRLKELYPNQGKITKDIPMGRVGKPEEYAALAVFLGSVQAGYITGQSIACDGGLIKAHS